MTSSNGNIFRATGPLCREFTGPVISPHNGQWRGALIFSLICAWINDWINNREAADLRRHRGHYDVIVMVLSLSWESIFQVRQTWYLRGATLTIFHVQPHIGFVPWGLFGTIINIDINKFRRWQSVWCQGNDNENVGKVDQNLTTINHTKNYEPCGCVLQCTVYDTRRTFISLFKLKWLVCWTTGLPMIAINGNGVTRLWFKDRNCEDNHFKHIWLMLFFRYCDLAVLSCRNDFGKCMASFRVNEIIALSECRLLVWYRKCILSPRWWVLICF